MAFIVDANKRDGTQRKQSTCIYVYGAHTNTQRTSVYATFIICNIFVGYALIRTFGTKGSVPLKRSQKNNDNQKNGNRNFRWIPPAVFSPFPYVISMSFSLFHFVSNFSFVFSYWHQLFLSDSIRIFLIKFDCQSSFCASSCEKIFQLKGIGQ